MPRYHFHFTWPDDAVRDTQGVELEGFGAAYRHACVPVSLVQRRIGGSKSARASGDDSNVILVPPSHMRRRAS